MKKKTPKSREPRIPILKTEHAPSPDTGLGLEDKREVIRDPKLSDLTALVQKPIEVEVEWKDKRIFITARVLTPAEDAEIDDMLAQVLPPIIQGKTPDQDRPNFQSPEYQKARLAAETRARAVALYKACPMFAQAHEQRLTEVKAITDFVQAQLNEQILKALYDAVRQGGVLAAYVNFI